MLGCTGFGEKVDELQVSRRRSFLGESQNYTWCEAGECRMLARLEEGDSGWDGCLEIQHSLKLSEIYY